MTSTQLTPDEMRQARAKAFWAWAKEGPQTALASFHGKPLATFAGGKYPPSARRGDRQRYTTATTTELNGVAFAAEQAKERAAIRAFLRDLHRLPGMAGRLDNDHVVRLVKRRRGGRVVTSGRVVFAERFVQLGVYRVGRVERHRLMLVSNLVLGKPLIVIGPLPA
jgi:hypothetical protein